MKLLRNVSLTIAGLSAAPLALAQQAPGSVDVSTVTTAFTTDANVIIAGIGMALLAAAGFAVVFKWAKAMFFG